jgi:hypothetical protein
MPLYEYMHLPLSFLGNGSVNRSHGNEYTRKNKKNCLNSRLLWVPISKESRWLILPVTSAIIIQDSAKNIFNVLCGKSASQIHWSFLSSKTQEPINRVTQTLLHSVTQLKPVSDCTANYTPVLSSEKAPYVKKKESNCQTKKIKICPTPRRIGQLSVGRNITWTWSSTWTKKSVGDNSVYMGINKISSYWESSKQNSRGS